MPRFAANLTFLFTELPFEDRFAAAAAAGFPAVEILFPYDVAADRVHELLDRNGLELVLMNAPPPVTDGTRGFPADPRESECFKRVMPDVLAYAAKVNPDLIHVMAGYETGQEAHESFVSNLQWLCDFAPHQRFAIEPLNGLVQRGYFLTDYQQAMDVLAEVARPNVGLQYDAYHAQVIHGDAARVWEDYGQYAIHAQIGAAPDRSEPGPGPVDFNALFAAMDADGYSGWVSAEYVPRTARTEDSLGWMAGWT